MKGPAEMSAPMLGSLLVAAVGLVLAAHLATVARYIETREKELLGRRWIPISESLPQADDGTPAATFLVWNRTDVIQAWREQDGRFTGVTGEHIPRVTHWMPMPAPPTDAK
jgi:hypothetical protein